MKRSRLIIVLILFLGIVLRLYHLPDLTIFDADQEYAAQFAHDVLKIYPLRFIGQGLSIQGLFLGPWYFYFLVPFYALFHLHPLGGYVGSIALGLLTICAYYFVGKAAGGNKTGLFMSLFRAVLFPFITWDILVTPAFSSDLLVLGTWFCLYKIWHKKIIYLLPLSVTFGLYTSIHPILVPFYLVLLILVFFQKIKPSLKLIAISSFLFMLPIIPLFAFEYFRKFTDINALFTLGEHGNGETKNLTVLWDYVKLILHFPPAILWVVLVKSLRDKFHYFMLIATSLVFLLYYYFLPIHVPPYYFMGATIVIFITMIVAFSNFAQRHKTLALAIAMWLIFLNLQPLKEQVNEPLKISFRAKEDVVKKIASLSPDNRMELGYDIDLGQHFGLGYLQRYYKIDNHGGENVPKYTIVIPLSRRPGEIDFSSGNVGLIIQ